LESLWIKVTRNHKVQLLLAWRERVQGKENKLYSASKSLVLTDWGSSLLIFSFSLSLA
jgi:hypothetical protein